MEEAASPVGLPRTGETIDRHVVVGEIARGGMAAVFAVKRTGAGGFEKLLALKMILPHLAGERRFVEMFLDEARLSSQIDHPNVCRVLDVGTHRSVPYLLMELVHGRSFAAIDERARATGLARDVLEAFWLSVLAQAADGLHAAHEARATDGEPLGIVHRDVSPQNILVGFDGRVRVVDFGIAAGRGRLVGTRTGEIKGKLAYLAPEQIQRDQTIGRATDLWGLGVVAWELLAGRRLFADAEEAKVLWSVMSARIPDLAREAPGLPREVVDVVMRCLERDATQRPVDARAVSRAFVDAAAEVARSAGKATPSVDATMRTLFPDAPPGWSAASDPAASAASAEAPRARPMRWIAPTAALLVAALAGAAISRSSSTTRTDAGAVDASPSAAVAPGAEPTRHVTEARAGSSASLIAAPPGSAAPVAPTSEPASSAEATPPARRPVAGPAQRGAARSTASAPPPPATGGRLMSNPF